MMIACQFDTKYFISCAAINNSELSINISKNFRRNEENRLKYLINESMKNYLLSESERRIEESKRIKAEGQISLIYSEKEYFYNRTKILQNEIEEWRERMKNIQFENINLSVSLDTCIQQQRERTHAALARAMRQAEEAKSTADELLCGYNYCRERAASYDD
eukprot:GHVR01108981.1.p1 GENE.GHVR01108981.1~~GHVR01108981.1.p1  ORF type:complete len:162 (-),score=50.19 GHVR01108981.1:59-544(-)